MANEFNAFGASGPGAGMLLITPSDTAANVFRALWVQGAGAVAFETNGITPTPPPTFPAGTWVVCAVTKVKATGTTATPIYGIV